MRSTVPPAEVAVDHRVARGLLAAQHPDLAGLALRRIGTGWDNAVFRLGERLTVRLPRRLLGAQLLENELRWLPVVSGALPLPVPVPVRSGEPSARYPWRWTVCRYVAGRPVGPRRLAGRAGLGAADALAGFLDALHVEAPPEAPHNPFRGVPLAERSPTLTRSLTAVPAPDRGRALAAWEAAVAAPAHAGPARWLHGDLHGLNVLASRGRITGVIDFGDMCAGDPATDLACAWLMLDEPGRRRLREALGVDEAQWARGRGWALFLSVMFLAHSLDAPGHEAIGLAGLAAVLGDGAG